MEVILRAVQKRVKEIVPQDLYWYDHITGDTLYGRGTNIALVYNRELKRTVPMVESHPQWVVRSDFPEIQEWVNKNQQRYEFDVIHSIPNQYVIIDVEDTAYEIMSQELRRSNIYHDQY